MLSYLYQLLLSHLNGGAGGCRDSMPVPCPSSLPTTNIFLWLMVQPSFIFPLLLCSCCLYSWPYISCGQKSTLALQVAGPYTRETGAWRHWGNHLYSFRSHGNKGFSWTLVRGKRQCPREAHTCLAKLWTLNYMYEAPLSLICAHQKVVPEY